MYGCQEGNIGIVKLLLQYQADTGVKDTKGNSLGQLHYR